MDGFTETQIREFYAELRRQATLSRHPEYAEGYSWTRLEEIAGPKAYLVFYILRDRGLIREEVLPGTYGHSRWHFVN